MGRDNMPFFVGGYSGQQCSEVGSVNGTNCGCSGFVYGRPVLL